MHLYKVFDTRHEWRRPKHGWSQWDWNPQPWLGSRHELPDSLMCGGFPIEMYILHMPPSLAGLLGTTI